MKCPQFGYFVTPRYDTQFATRDAFEQFLIDGQRNVYTGYTPAVLTPNRPNGDEGQIRTTADSVCEIFRRPHIRGHIAFDACSGEKTKHTLELEQLFPSMALEFTSLDASKLQADVAVASRYDPDAFFFMRQPRSWLDYDNGTTWHGTVDEPFRFYRHCIRSEFDPHCVDPRDTGEGGLKHPWHAIGGRSWMLPTMQSWLANALLRAGLETERNTTIKFGVRRFPSTSRRVHLTLGMARLS